MLTSKCKIDTVATLASFDYKMLTIVAAPVPLFALFSKEGGPTGPGDLSPVGRDALGAPRNPRPTNPKSQSLIPRGGPPVQSAIS